MGEMSPARRKAWEFPGPPSIDDSRRAEAPSSFFLFSFEKLLRSPLVEVDACMELEEAFELPASRNYAAVITDYRFSHTESNEGLDVLVYIREHTPATPGDLSYRLWQ